MLSLEERERRLKAVREKMEERGIDVLLVSSNGEVNERGKLRYISYWPTVMFDNYIILPKRGEMKYFGHYGLDANLVKEKCGIKETYYPPYGENPGPHIANLIKKLNPKRIGLCGTRNLTAYVYRALVKNLEGIEIEEATDIIDNLKMVKSPEELKYVEKAAAIADFAMDHFRKILKPGKVERDLVYEVDCEIKKKGVEDSFYFIGSGKIPPISFPVFFSTRKIEDGDLVLFNVEFLGEEGYGTQSVRFFSLGKPVKEALKVMRFLKPRLRQDAKIRYTGSRICDVANAMIDVVKGKRIYHGSSHGPWPGP